MDNQKPSSSSDEIDLGRLFTKLGEGFSAMGTGFVRFIAAVRRVPLDNKLSFTIVILGSLVFGYLFAKQLRQHYYESTMILSSDYLNKRLAESSIEKLTMLASERDKQGLARILNLHDTLADNILRFDVKPFVGENEIIELEVLKEQLRTAQASLNNKEVIDQILKRIEIENRHAFEITVRTLNPGVIPNLQDALVGYFSENPYIKKRVENYGKALSQRKLMLTSDLRKIDSLKKVIYANYQSMAERKEGSNNVILGDKPVSDPVQVYSQGLAFYNQLQEVEKAMVLRPDFEVVEGFTEFSEPASPSLMTILIYSFGIGVGFSYLGVALRHLNAYLSTVN